MLKFMKTPAVLWGLLSLSIVIMAESNEVQTNDDDEESYDSIDKTTADRCFQPPKSGAENCGDSASLEVDMYYFEKVTRQCMHYKYTGCGGNMNRFTSLRQCEDTCGTQEVYHAITKLSKKHCADEPIPNKNVNSLDWQCSLGSTNRWFYDKKSGSCKIQPFNSCVDSPNNFLTRWDCETYCLIPIEEVKPHQCELPLQNGTLGPEVSERWYFDPQYTTLEARGACRPFTYLGSNGNQNNFLFKHTCYLKCRHRMHCDRLSRYKKAYEFPDIYHPEQCGVMVNSAKDCPRVERYTFNKYKGVCEKFDYYGCGISLNVFDSMELCESACPKTRMDYRCQSEMASRCVNKSNKDIKKVFYFSGVSGMCKMALYEEKCDISNFPKDGEECVELCRIKETTAKDIQHKCFARPSSTALVRNTNECGVSDVSKYWIYHHEAKVCFPLSYCERFNCSSSVQLAGNTFESAASCQSTCNPKDFADICHQDLETGPCRKFTERYYFNAETGKCVRFRYGGCLGNGNRFVTSKECYEFCGKLNENVDRLDFLRRNNFKYENETHLFAYLRSRITDKMKNDLARLNGVFKKRYVLSPCKKHLHYGVCSRHTNFGENPVPLDRYYFDDERKKCVQFPFTGCVMVANHFNTLEKCNHVCTNRFRDLQENECKAFAEESCANHKRLWYFNRLKNECKPIKICHSFNRVGVYANKIDCEYRCKRDSAHGLVLTNICLLDSGRGDDCGQKTRRWRFDYETGQCGQAMLCIEYGNSFGSQLDCITACSPLSQIELCQLPLDHGIGEESTLRWHYNWNMHTCTPFVYFGSLGNSNNFNSFDECDHFCAINDVCLSGRPQNASGRGEVLFYYSAKHRGCVEYRHYHSVFQGDNEFPTWTKCERKCRFQLDVIPSFDVEAWSPADVNLYIDFLKKENMST